MRVVRSHEWGRAGSVGLRGTHWSQTTVWPSPYLGIREDSVASATTRRQSAAPLTRSCRFPPRHEPVGQGPSFRLVSSAVAAAQLSAAGERGWRALA